MCLLSKAFTTVQLAHVQTNGIYSVPTWGTYIGTRKLFEIEDKKKAGHIETFTANEDKLEQQLLRNMSKKSLAILVEKCS